MPMRPLAEFSPDALRAVQFVLCDIDDTLTHQGRLPAVAYIALELLQRAGLKVVPVTGRPAGWCDHIARMWPVDALVGENGAFYFRYDHAAHIMTRCYFKDAAARRRDRARLEALQREILSAVPGAAVAADQVYREADLAIDFCEDVPPLDRAAIDEIVAHFQAAGAKAKISSIHVNGWFGDYDKLTMTRRLFLEVFGEDLEAVKKSVIYVGDSPNDAPMFAYFPNAVGVANVCEFSGRLAAEPAWVTENPGGYGFAELTETLLKVRGGV